MHIQVINSLMLIEEKGEGSMSSFWKNIISKMKAMNCNLKLPKIINDMLQGITRSIRCSICNGLLICIIDTVEVDIFIVFNF